MKSSPPPTEDAMSVDKSADESQTTLSASSFLAGCMSYPYSPSPLRTALRTVFSEGDELLTLLRTIVDWLDDVVKRDLPLEEDPISEHTAPTTTKKQPKRSQLQAIAEPPPLENVSDFLVSSVCH